MRNNETGEFELVVGNKQLLSGFFIVVLLFAVAWFAMGYVVGQNTQRPARLASEGGPASRAPNTAADSRPQRARHRRPGSGIVHSARAGCCRWANSNGGGASAHHTTHNPAVAAGRSREGRRSARVHGRRHLGRIAAGIVLAGGRSEARGSRGDAVHAQGQRLSGDTDSRNQQPHSRTRRALQRLTLFRAGPRRNWKLPDSGRCGTSVIDSLVQIGGAADAAPKGPPPSPSGRDAARRTSNR